MNKTSRSLENKTRMTIGGKRYRVGNPKHPFYKIYVTQGFDAVYEAMGLIDNAATKIRLEVLALYNKHVEGYVYIISNPAWPEWVKVGMAVDAADRCSSYQTSSPFRDYVVEYSFASTNRRKDESIAHQKLAAISQDRRGEWFKLPVSEAIGCISGITK